MGAWASSRSYYAGPRLDDVTLYRSFFALSELLVEMRTPSGFVFQDKEVAIYRLFHNSQLEGDGLRVVQPTVDELGRLHGQRGLFTWLDSERFFELQGFLDNTGRGDLLSQIVIADQAVFDGLRDLRAHGIDHRLLFPDLIGAASYANTLGNAL